VVALRGCWGCSGERPRRVGEPAAAPKPSPSFACAGEPFIAGWLSEVDYLFHSRSDLSMNITSLAKLIGPTPLRSPLNPTVLNSMDCGGITLTRGGKAETFRVGDSCAVAAGEVHAEHVGPQGVAYIAARRNIAA
jgi:hypothetical protein